MVTANLEYIWRPPYGNPEDWHNGEYIGVQKFLPDFIPATLCDVAIYNSLWPTKQILYLGKHVPPLDDALDFDNICPSQGIQEHFEAAEMEYLREFVSRCPLQYYIEWFQSHNNIEEVVDDNDNSCDLKPPSSRHPKMVLGCN